MQRRSLVSAALAAGLLLAAAGCADSDPKTSGGAAASTLKIGLLGSLSGTYQAVGTDLKTASSSTWRRTTASSAATRSS